MLSLESLDAFSIFENHLIIEGWKSVSELGNKPLILTILRSQLRLILIVPTVVMALSASTRTHAITYNYTGNTLSDGGPLPHVLFTS